MIILTEKDMAAPDSTIYLQRNKILSIYEQWDKVGAARPRALVLTTSLRSNQSKRYHFATGP